MPRTAGDAGIPFDALTAYVEGEQDLYTAPTARADPVADAIAAHVAPWIGDGATLQTGVGTIPGAILAALTGRRKLQIHSGLVDDEVGDLISACALAGALCVMARVGVWANREVGESGGGKKCG